MSRILIAEDEPGIRTFLRDTLEGAGHDVVTVDDGLAALAAIREHAFDLLLTDLRMPGADGMTVVRAVRTEQPDVEVIVLTAFGTVSTAVEALKLGAFDYLEKPVESPRDLRNLVGRALERRRQLAATEASASAPLSFGAPAMTTFVSALERVARSGATVLLEGEPGAGKEVAARALHAASPRAQAPFVSINCAAHSEPLLESELFGHEAGAFPGAATQRRGRLELADGGTFFFDEIAELPRAVQARLLRVLGEGRFERVGGVTPIHLDVRWIAATRHRLVSRVNEGAFREDLYHRLAAFPLVLPPLRARVEDIVPLAETFLPEGRTLSEASKARLRAAPWPGNVRQLKNAIERAVILSDGPVLGPELFDAPAGSSPPEDHSLERLERDAIEAALAAVGGNRKSAAARLGIGLRTLYEKLKRYDIR